MVVLNSQPDIPNGTHRAGVNGNRMNGFHGTANAQFNQGIGGGKDLNDLVANFVFSRQEFMKRLLDPRRDINFECGYPETTSINKDTYRELWDRSEIANRVVSILPIESWKSQPAVYEDEDTETVTIFEKTWDDLCKGLRGDSSFQDEDGNPIWEHLRRADILSGIGAFGVILLGLDDGKELDQPAPGFEADQQRYAEGTQEQYGPLGFGGPAFNKRMSRRRRQLLFNFVKAIKDDQNDPEKRKRKNLLPKKNRSYMEEGEEEKYADYKDYNTRSIMEDDPSEEFMDRNILPDGTQVEVDEDGKPLGDPRQAMLAGADPSDDMDPMADVQGYQGLAEGDDGGEEELVDEDGNPVDPSELEQELDEDGNPGTPYPIDPNDMGGDTDEFGNPIRDTGAGMVGEGQALTDDPDEMAEMLPEHVGPKLIYLRCFDESLVQITRYCSDKWSARYGQPEMYSITLNNPQDQQSGIGLPLATVNVHWSRVVHIADNYPSSSSEVFGVPRMRPVLNRLLDHAKIQGGSAEMHWRNAFPVLSIETHPQLGSDVKIDVEKLKNVVEDAQNSLQRQIISEGVTVKSIASQWVDPSVFIDTMLTSICIQLGIPKRIFMGSERGELASGQDDGTWQDRMNDRQRNYLTPKIIVPFVDRLIQINVLPRPKGFSVEWPDLNSMKPVEQAQLAQQRITAMAAYISGGVDSLMGPQDVLTREFGYDEEEASTILENALDHMAEVNAPGMGGEGFAPGHDPESQSMPAIDPETGEYMRDEQGNYLDEMGMPMEDLSIDPETGEPAEPLDTLASQGGRDNVNEPSMPFGQEPGQPFGEGEEGEEDTGDSPFSGKGKKKEKPKPKDKGKGKNPFVKNYLYVRNENDVHMPAGTSHGGQFGPQTGVSKGAKPRKRKSTAGTNLKNLAYKTETIHGKPVNVIRGSNGRLFPRGADGRPVSTTLLKPEDRDKVSGRGSAGGKSHSVSSPQQRDFMKETREKLVKEYPHLVSSDINASVAGHGKRIAAKSSFAAGEAVKHQTDRLAEDLHGHIVTKVKGKELSDEDRQSTLKVIKHKLRGFASGVADLVGGVTRDHVSGVTDLAVGLAVKKAIDYFSGTSDLGNAYLLSRAASKTFTGGSASGVQPPPTEGGIGGTQPRPPKPPNSPPTGGMPTKGPSKAPNASGVWGGTKPAPEGYKPPKAKAKPLKAKPKVNKLKQHSKARVLKPKQSKGKRATYNEQSYEEHMQQRVAQYILTHNLSEQQTSNLLTNAMIDVMNYDANQPRDDQGKWSRVGYRAGQIAKGAIIGGTVIGGLAGGTATLMGARTMRIMGFPTKPALKILFKKPVGPMAGAPMQGLGRRVTQFGVGAGALLGGYSGATGELDLTDEDKARIDAEPRVSGKEVLKGLGIETAKAGAGVGVGYGGTKLGIKVGKTIGKGIGRVLPAKYGGGQFGASKFIGEEIGGFVGSLAGSDLSVKGASKLLGPSGAIGAALGATWPKLGRKDGGDDGGGGFFKGPPSKGPRRALKLPRLEEVMSGGKTVGGRVIKKAKESLMPEYTIANREHDWRFLDET